MVGWAARFQNFQRIVIDTWGHLIIVLSTMPLFENKPPDPRVVATRSISRSVIPILLICIPLVAIVRSPILPFFVIGGAAVAIAGVWLFGQTRVVVEKPSEEIAELKNTIKELQERLENVEVINRFEEALAEKSLREQGGAGTRRSMGAFAADKENSEIS